MPETVTKVEITELPDVFQAKINSDINEGFSVLDIEKTVTISRRTGKTYVDFKVKLNQEGFFVEYRLGVFPHRDAKESDIHVSYITSADILFYIMSNEKLFSRVSDLINPKNES